MGKIKHARSYKVGVINTRRRHRWTIHKTAEYFGISASNIAMWEQLPHITRHCLPLTPDERRQLHYGDYKEGK
jgi:hypothetical protein